MIKKQYIEKLILALIANLNPKITMLNPQQRSEIDSAVKERPQINSIGAPKENILSFQELAGISEARISFTVGVFIVLKDSTAYNAYAKKHKKLAAQDIYELVVNELNVSIIIESAKEMINKSRRVSSLPASSDSSSSSPESSSSRVNSSSILQSSLSFFSNPSRTQSSSYSSHSASSSSFRAKCAALLQKVSGPKTNYLPLMIIASSIDENIALALCDDSLAKDIGDVDLHYLKSFARRFAGQNVRIKQLYERNKSLSSNVDEEGMDEQAITYFVIKMKTNNSFAASVITSSLLQTLLEDLEEQLCINLAINICTEKEQGEQLLQFICATGLWEHMYFKHSRIIIITLIYTLIEKYKFIPDQLLNENLLAMYIEVEFSNLTRMISTCNLKTTIAEKILRIVRGDIAFVRILSNPERSYRISSLISTFVESEPFVYAMSNHFNECTEAIAVVFSKIGHRKTAERSMKPQVYANYISRLKKWFSYEALTSDPTVKRAFCAGLELANAHQRKTSDDKYLFLTQSYINRYFDRAAGAARTEIKHKFVAIHESLARLFEDTFLPHIEECLTNLCETRASYYRIMIYRLETHDPNACNPENYELNHFPKVMSQYFETHHKRAHLALLGEMQLVYEEQQKFEERHNQDKLNMKVNGYETISYIAETILRIKIPATDTTQVINLGEFTKKIKLIIHETLQNLPDKMSHTISPSLSIPDQKLFNVDEELYVRNDLSGNIIEALKPITRVDSGKIFISNEKQFKSKLDAIVRESLEKKQAPSSSSSSVKLTPS